MDEPQIRQLSIGEILDVGINVVVRNFAVFLRIVFFIVAPIQVVIALAALSATPDKTNKLETGSVTFGQSNVSGSRLAVIVVSVILGWVASTIASGACFKAVAEAYLGKKPAAAPSLRFAVSRLRPLIWLTILSGFLTLLGFLACVVPGIWLVGFWAVAIPALLMEDERGMRALGRSRELTEGFYWRALGIVVLGGLIAGFVGGLVGGISGALSIAAPDNAIAQFLVSAVGGTVSALISTPLQAAFITILYFDLRVRQEGFDLQLIAERLEKGFSGSGSDPDRTRWRSTFEKAPASPTVDPWKPLQEEISPAEWEPGSGSVLRPPQEPPAEE